MSRKRNEQIRGGGWGGGWGGGGVWETKGRSTTCAKRDASKKRKKRPENRSVKAHKKKIKPTKRRKRGRRNLPTKGGE